MRRPNLQFRHYQKRTALPQSCTGCNANCVYQSIGVCEMAKNSGELLGRMRWQSAVERDIGPGACVLLTDGGVYDNHEVAI